MRLCQILMVFKLVFELSFEPVVGINVTDFLTKVPWVGNEFQQIIIVSENSSGILQVKDNLKEGLTLMETSFNSTLTLDAGILTLTAVIIQAENEDSLFQLLRKTFVFPKAANESYGGPLQSNIFYFILWPRNLPNEDLESEFVPKVRDLSLLVPLDWDIFYVIQDGRADADLALFESYSIQDFEVIQQVETEILTPYLVFKLIKYKWHRRNDFYGMTLVATGTKDPIYEPEVNITVHSNGTAELVNGMAVSIFRIFRDHLNFTEAAIVGEYMGEPITDPGVLGMETYLQEGTADIAVTESGVSDDKAKVVTLLHATTANRLECRFSQDPKSKWKFFAGPFAVPVWFLIFLYVVTMIFSMTWARYVLRSSNQEEKGTDHSAQTWYASIQLDFLWALGTLCQQGWYLWPNKAPFKMLFLVASVTGFLLNAAYSGTITSQLSVRDPVTLTFEKLLNSSFLFFMENDFDFPVDPETYPKPIRIKTLYNANDSVVAVESLLKVKSALISYPEFFYFAVQHADDITDATACHEFTTIRVSQVPSLCSMAVKKVSPFKEVLNVKIVFIWERGVLPRLNTVYKSKSQLRCEFDNHRLEPQSLGELFLAFSVIGAGLVASAGALMIEVLIAVIRQSLLRHSEMYSANLPNKVRKGSPY